MEIEDGIQRPESKYNVSEATGETVSPPERVDNAPRFDSSRALRLLKELGTNVTEDLVVLMPNLLSFLKHNDPAVVRQSIASGTILFAGILEEMSFQLNTSPSIDGWLGEMWSWMIQFKDAVHVMMLEPGSIATKLLAVKFLETCVIYFTPQVLDNHVCLTEGKERSFKISQLARGHPSLNHTVVEADADRILGLLLDILQSTHMPGSLIVAVVNCLAAIAKNRPLHYDCILSALVDFDPSIETVKGVHSASIRYCLRTAFVGFLRCNHPVMVESREKLLKALRAVSPGETTDQIIRQLDKMSRNLERSSRDVRVGKYDQPPGEMSASGDFLKKKPLAQSSDIPVINDDIPSKRTWFDTTAILNRPVHMASDSRDDDDPITNCSLDASFLNSDLTPAETMIAMIGALLAEGERGVESLELLISNIHADLLADIVIVTMRHLPKTSDMLSARHGNPPSTFQSSLSVSLENVSSPVGAVSAHSAVSGHAADLPSQLVSVSADSNGTNPSTSDMPILSSIPADVSRDPRRDPRRLDPRRALVSAVPNPGALNTESATEVQYGPSHSSNDPSDVSEIKVGTGSETVFPKFDVEQTEVSSEIGQLASKENLVPLKNATEPKLSLDDKAQCGMGLPPVASGGQEPANSASSDVTTNDGVDGNMMESDQYSPPTTRMSMADDACHDIPMLPLHVELTAEGKKTMHKLAVKRVIDYTEKNHINTRLPLLARLVAQNDTDHDILELLVKHIIFDYHHHKGHELALHVLYHLQTLIVSDSEDPSSSVANLYESFLITLAKSLIDSLPASNKSLSRLLGEAPFLPDSVFRLLEDLFDKFSTGQHGKDTDGDRVTQCLGTVWSLILGRPPCRQACLEIALKCAVHSRDEVRAKAIRLVANKLYLLSYASEKIEQFATNMLLSVVDQQVSEADTNHTFSRESKELGSQEVSISSPQNSDLGASEGESMKSTVLSPKSSAVSASEAQRQTALFFALCTKKPSLLRLVFEVYGRAPKSVKQSIHRHVPILVRNLGPSFSELLNIIYELPDGSEKLIILILQILTEESTPPTELIVAVKHLYKNRLKDAGILIPMLSSLSKEEVLPIFPGLVDLPLEKFQAALARILQGSAHSGPALTPAEVLIAIHDIDPEKDGVALKKITEACTACFEQRTVFTQQVLAKSLSQLVEKLPLPLLFMRTVIQAVDAFPALVDFIMGILSKLVAKKIWKMPKLWVGFLKCAYQIQPRSFHVLLELPPPQLENALNKYPNLRAPLASHVSQQSTCSTIPRETLKALGLVTEPQQTATTYTPASVQTSGSSASIQGAAPT